MQTVGKLWDFKGVSVNAMMSLIWQPWEVWYSSLITVSTFISSQGFGPLPCRSFGEPSAFVFQGSRTTSHRALRQKIGVLDCKLRTLFALLLPPPLRLPWKVVFLGHLHICLSRGRPQGATQDQVEKMYPEQPLRTVHSGKPFTRRLSEQGSIFGSTLIQEQKISQDYVNV